MPVFNPNKKIKIEIRQCIHPAMDYEVWDLQKNRCIQRNAQEEDFQSILKGSEYPKFKEGKTTFVVTADELSNTFSYLY